MIVAVEQVLEAQQEKRSLTLAEFLSSPESDQNYEFIDMSPKRFHAALQDVLYRYLGDLFEGKGCLS